MPAETATDLKELLKNALLKELRLVRGTGVNILNLYGNYYKTILTKIKNFHI